MTATITATAEPAATPPRVRLNVTTNQSTIVLYRVAADGTKTLVRSYDGNPFLVTSGSLIVYDPEAPLGLPVSYTADGTGVTNSAVVTVTGVDSWLVHPGNPSLSQLITVATIGDRSYEASQSVRYPLGRKYPIAVSDGVRKAPSYPLGIYTLTLGDLGAVEALLADVSPLLLQVPASLGWGQVSEYVAVGKVTAGHVVPVGTEPMRLWTLSCSVVDRPVGGAQATNTYAKSFAQYPTYGARYTAAATYGAAFNS